MTVKCMLLCEQPLDLGISTGVMWSSSFKGRECEGWGGEKRGHARILLHVFLQLALIASQKVLLARTSLEPLI